MKDMDTMTMTMILDTMEIMITTIMNTLKYTD